MNEKEKIKIKNKLEEVLSPESGYFGKVFTYGQTKNMFEPVGYRLSEDILPTLKNMTEEQTKSLNRIIIYFEAHAHSLKHILWAEEKHALYDFYNQMTWSQFSTIIMFGMLEIATKKTMRVKLKSKGEKMKKFLISNVTEETRTSIAKRFKAINNNDGKNIIIHTFEDAFDCMWKNIRCGFIHSAGIEHCGLEDMYFKGMGTSEDPLTVEENVSMQEWLKTTWLAILHSYGYNGTLIPSNPKGESYHYSSPTT